MILLMNMIDVVRPRRHPAMRIKPVFDYFLSHVWF